MIKKTSGEIIGKKLPEITPLKIDWNISDTIITRFCTNLIVQIFENGFKLSFFEVKPEIHLTPPKIQPTSVKADCVASVFVTPDKMPSFIDVLQRQFKLYNEKINELSKIKPTKQ